MLAILNLDHFKSVNDIYGHIVGDSLLEVIGREIQNAFQNMLVCRFGGDEFCIIAKLDGQNLINRLNAFLKFLHQKEFTEAKISLTCSAGICCQPMNSLEELIRKADSNLQEAKRLGRDRMVTDL